MNYIAKRNIREICYVKKFVAWIINRSIYFPSTYYTATI